MDWTDMIPVAGLVVGAITLWVILRDRRPYVTVESRLGLENDLTKSTRIITVKNPSLKTAHIRDVIFTVPYGVEVRISEVPPHWIDMSDEDQSIERSLKPETRTYFYADRRSIATKFKEQGVHGEVKVTPVVEHSIDRRDSGEGFWVDTNTDSWDAYLNP